MRRALLLCVVVSAVVSFAQAPAVKSPSPSNPQAEAVSQSRVPVKRVVLFKNGVGYFEHVGSVTGTQNVSIDFTTAQLNDVLKSLTVIDLGQGRISGVSYNSVEPLERQLGSLRLGLGQEVTGGQFLSALKGARVEVRSGAQAVTGRVLSVEERESKNAKEDTVKIAYLSLVSDGGELRQFEMTPSLGVRLLESEMREDVNRYLSVLASGREQDLRRMVIRDSGTGTRPLQVSYISEVPVWKSTYRLVLPSDKTKPFIQGWAIVDNTVGEDWKDVELSLVAGAPQSFVQELSKPFYARRPQIALPETAMLTPQTHERATETAQEEADAALVMPSAIPMSIPRRGVVGGVGGVVGGVAGGTPGGVIGGIIASSPAPVPVHKMAAQEAAASGNDLGDMFEYRLKDKVTIRKNQSALVPIIQATVEAEKVTLFGEGSFQPLRAVWLNNTSGLTLDGGTFNVLDGEVFAGEGILDPIKPGERRLLSYAMDQGVVLNTEGDTEYKQVTRVVIRYGTMRQTREALTTRTYIVRNMNTDTRNVVLEHPTKPGWKLVSATKPDETTPTRYRFKVKVEPKETVKLVVNEAYPVDSAVALTNLDSASVETFVQAKSITPEIETILRQVVAKQEVIHRLDTDILSRNSQRQTITADQSRLRENMKALKGSAEEKALIQRYARQLDEQETTLDRLKKEIDDLQEQRDAAKAAVENTIETLHLEVSL